MIDWRQVIEANDQDSLKQVKLWLFQESIRIENEKKDLAESQNRFLKERIKYKDDLEALNRKTVIERKRLKEENMFFDKKMAILKAGFEQLEADRKSFENEKKKYINQRRSEEPVVVTGSSDIAKRLFQNVNNPLALRKRYRDLVKIFHPDNMYGDSELVAMINKEFFRRKREE